MPNDQNTIDEVDKQVDLLQNKLKDRLKQTQDLSDLNNDVFKSSMKIEKSTAKLKETAVKTKWYWFWEWLKWASIAFFCVTVVVLIILNKMGLIGHGSSNGTTTYQENDTNGTDNTDNQTEGTAHEEENNEDNNKDNNEQNNEDNNTNEE